MKNTRFDWLERYEIAQSNNLPVAYLEVVSGLMRWVGDIEHRLIDRRGRGRFPASPKYSTNLLIGRAPSVNAAAPMRRMLAEDMFEHAFYMGKLLGDDDLKTEIDRMSAERQTNAAVNIMSSLPSAVSCLVWICERIETYLFNDELGKRLVVEETINNEPDQT